MDYHLIGDLVKNTQFSILRVQRNFKNKQTTILWTRLRAIIKQEKTDQGWDRA